MTKKTTKIDTNSSDSKNTGFKDKRSPEKLAQDQIKLERERIGLIKDQVELAKKQEELKFKELLNKERERREKEAKSFGHRLDALSKAFHNSMTGRTLSATRDSAKFMTRGVKQAYSGYGQAVHGVEDTVKNVVSGLSGPLNAKVTTNGVLTNTLVSALTGGVLNPVVMQAMGLNKLASSMWGAGKGVVKTGAGLIKGTAGAVKAGLGGVGTGLGILGTPFALAGDGIGKLFSLNNNDDTSASKTAGKRSNKAYQEAIIQKLDRIDKNTTKTDEKKEEDKGNSIIQTMLKAAVGLAMAFAAVKTGLLDFLGEKIGEGANKIGQFFGIEGGAEVAGNFIKDAIPGAIIGLPFGLKGALVGGVLSLVGNSVKRFMDMTGDLDGDAKPDSMGLGESALRGAITGGLAGWTIGSTLKSPVKGAMIGMLLGAVGGVIAKTIAKIKDWFENFDVIETGKELISKSWNYVTNFGNNEEAVGEANNQQLKTKQDIGDYIPLERDSLENDAPATFNSTQSLSSGTTTGKVPLPANFYRKNDLANTPEYILNNVQAIRSNLIDPLQDALDKNGRGNKVTVTSSYRSPKYNASVHGATNSRHLTGKAADLQVSGMTPDQVVAFMQQNGIPFDRAIMEKNGRSQWLHVEYDTGGSHAGALAKMDVRTGKYTALSTGNSLGTPDMSKVAMSTSSSTPSVSQMTSNQLGNIEASTAQTADNTLDMASNDSTPVTTTTAEGSTGSNGSWFDNLFKSNSNQNTQVTSNSGGNSSSSGSSDDSSMIYACGDFARTLVLGYPSPSV